VIADSPELARDLLDHGGAMRQGAVLVAQGGQITAAKLASHRLYRAFATWLFVPTLKLLRIYDQF
jgi:hypothetical protein